MRACVLCVIVLLMPAVVFGANVVTLYEPTDAEVLAWNPLPATCGLVADPFGTGAEVLMINQPAKPGGYATRTATTLATTLADAPLYGTVSVDVAFGTPSRSEGSMGLHLANACPPGATQDPGSYYLHTGGTEINNAGAGPHQGSDAPYLFEEPVGWHTYTVVFNGSTAATYVGNLLFNLTPYDAGFSSVAMVFHGRAYVHDFRYTAQVVPEPATLTLLLLCAPWIFMRRRARA